MVISSLMSVLLFNSLHDQARQRLLHTGIAASGDVTGVIIATCVAFSAIVALAFGVWCLVFTHRICGPLFVLERNLNELAAGNMPPHRPLRKRDEFREIHAAFWQVVRALRNNKQATLATLTEAHQALTAAGHKAGDQDARSLHVTAERVQAAMTQTANELGESIDGCNAPGSDQCPNDASPVMHYADLPA